MQLLAHVKRAFDPSTDSRSGTNSNGDWEIKTQEVWVQLGDEPFPQKIKVPLEKNQMPLRLGECFLNVKIAIGQYQKPVAYFSLQQTPEQVIKAKKAS